MQFRLLYEGKIKTNGGPKEKHQIRKHFHPQLKELWQHPPLVDFKEELIDTPQSHHINIIHQTGNFKFAPLVTKKIHLVAELDILLLRPEEPGKVIVSGDIDNLTKTLFDALRCPLAITEIPAGEVPSADEIPFFCLLQDDSLITSVKITSDRLLRYDDLSQIFVIIQVTVKATRLIIGNMGIG